MYEYNLAHLDQDIETLMRERKHKKKDHMRMCSECKRFYSNRTFYKHKEKCGGESNPIKQETLTPLRRNIHQDQDFVCS